jgi:prepilin-type N-terminal cleavage/methylation domain-containing protein
MFARAGANIGKRALRARGFTFPEVLAVIVVLGIASAVVLPQVTSNDDLNAGSAARAVMADLLYAQNRAISTQSTQYVSFNIASQQYGLYCSMSPMLVLQHPVNLNDYVMTFGQSGPNNVSQTATLVSASFNGQSTIAFDETGVPYSWNSGTLTTLTGPGSIVLQCGNYSLTISVAKDTGDITVN